MRMSKLSIAALMGLMTVGAASRIQQITPREIAIRELTRPSRASKGNKITKPDSNGVYKSNVQDNSTDKVHAIHKRSRKNEKRSHDYRTCLVNNTLISVEDFRLLTFL
jgi:hypothetical protein